MIAGATSRPGQRSPCQPGAGNGCYVDLPLALTKLFIAVSENHDIKLTARVVESSSSGVKSSRAIAVILWPRVESNHRAQIRSLPLYPLSYGAGRT